MSTQESPKCFCCGRQMDESKTNFTVVKPTHVYVVRDVPCLECSFCGYTSFSQETARALERLTSGRSVPHKRLTAWVYQWGVPTEQIPDSSTIQRGTINKVETSDELVNVS